MTSNYASLANCTLKIHLYWIILLIATVLQFRKQKKLIVFDRLNLMFLLLIRMCCSFVLDVMF